MSFVRLTALSIALTACGSFAAEPPPSGDDAPAAPSPSEFAAPRPIDRAADPMAPASAGQPQLRLGLPFTPAGEAPTVSPQRDAPDVLAELQHNAGYLQRCWQGRAGAARSGSIVIHAHIGADGLVQGQCITADTVGDGELVRCANDVIAMGRYPKLGDGTVDVVFPFHFGGGAG